MKCLVIFSLVLLGLTSSGAISILDILEKIPADERFEFVKYHIQKGYELMHQEEKDIPRISQSHDFKTEEAPSVVSILLYTYAKHNALVTDEAVVKQMREVVCFPDGACIDLGDIGVHP